MRLPPKGSAAVRVVKSLALRCGAVQRLVRASLSKFDLAVVRHSTPTRITGAMRARLAASAVRGDA
jgi:hypothetical protein